MGKEAIRSSRLGRPRTQTETHKAIMFRFPAPFVALLHAIAEDEERSINTVAFRLFREALVARGVAMPQVVPDVDTRYSAS